MADYWKSTPKYWCKHCGIHVRDTPLERANHEATGKHQGALKRFLRDLHRTHEREEREKERAKREVDRLNGVVSGTPSSSGFKPAGERGAGAATGGGVADERKRQLEQLTSLGVAVPQDVRGDMALAGEWTVTSVRVIPEVDESTTAETPEGVAKGVRKRVVTEEEKEEEEAVKGLFKKARRWGRDTKVLGEDDSALDDLLGGFKKEVKDETVKEEIKKEIKEEGPEDNADPTQDTIKKEEEDTKIKLEPLDGANEEEEEKVDVSPVVFKKRRPKGIRQK